MVQDEQRYFWGTIFQDIKDQKSTKFPHPEDKTNTHTRHAQIHTHTLVHTHAHTRARRQSTLASCFPVNCETSPWAEWGVCTRNGQTCGYKYGLQTRSRDVLQAPSSNGQKCPATSESRRCKLKYRSCVGESSCFVAQSCSTRFAFVSMRFVLYREKESIWTKKGHLEL